MPKLLLALLRLLPLKHCQKLGHVVGQYLWLSNSRMRTTTEINLKHCFSDLNLSDQKRLTKASLIETGKCLVEMPKIWSTPFKQCNAWIQDIQNEPLLDTSLAAPRGLLLILPHLGNWEIVNHYLVGKTQLTAMYKPAKIAAMEQFVLAARSHPNTTMVPANTKGVKTLFKTLKKAGVGVLLADQEPEPPSGTFAPFFGVMAYTSTLAAKMIQKTHCHVLCIFAKRLQQHNGFEINISPLVKPYLENTSTETLTEIINQSIEHCASTVIEQYQWEYKRFKRRPNNEPAFY